MNPRLLAPRWCPAGGAFLCAEKVQSVLVNNEVAQRTVSGEGVTERVLLLKGPRSEVGFSAPEPHPS